MSALKLSQELWICPKFNVRKWANGTFPRQFLSKTLYYWWWIFNLIQQQIQCAQVDQWYFPMSIPFENSFLLVMKLRYIFLIQKQLNNQLNGASKVKHDRKDHVKVAQKSKQFWLFSLIVVELCISNAFQLSRQWIKTTIWLFSDVCVKRFVENRLERGEKIHAFNAPQWAFPESNY